VFLRLRKYLVPRRLREARGIEARRREAPFVLVMRVQRTAVACERWVPSPSAASARRRAAREAQFRRARGRSQVCRSTCLSRATCALGPVARREPQGGAPDWPPAVPLGDPARA
jgi:hypothetical protein